jgi:hypothetical protein
MCNWKLPGRRNFLENSDRTKGDCVEITQFYAKPSKGYAPTTFYFLGTFDILKNWTGTGMAYFQVTDGQDLVANNGQLLEFPQSHGNHSITFNVQCDDTWNGGGYYANLLICEGECDEFGPSNHPYTRLLANATTSFSCVVDDLR